MSLLVLPLACIAVLRVAARPPRQVPVDAANPHGVYNSHIPECFSYLHFE